MMCKKGRKKKQQEASKKSKKKMDPSKQLSNKYHPPKAPSRFLLWQAYFTMQCFDDEIYATKTINRVIAPFALSTSLAALHRGSTGVTFKFFTKLLHVECFYPQKTFEQDLFQVLNDFPFNKIDDLKSINTVAKLIFLNDMKPSEKWEKYVTESLKLEIVTFDSPNLEKNYEIVNNSINYAIGNSACINTERKLCSQDTQLLTVIGTRVKAMFANTETYSFKRTSFLMGYGLKEKSHPFFIARGDFANVTFNDFEAWRIPLKQSDRISLNFDDSYEPKMCLVLVRPTKVGSLRDIESTENFDEIAKAINILIQRKRKKSTLLIPEIDIPFAPNYGIKDFIPHWKKIFGEQVTSNMGKAADGLFKSCALDRFFHCASIRITADGISYSGDVEESTPNTTILDADNSLKAKRNKNNVDDTKSAKLQKMIDAKFSLPLSLLKQPRREKVYHFHARFDSPFLFFIVDEKWASILLAGSYAGRPAPSASYLSRPAPKPKATTPSTKSKKKKKSSSKKKKSTKQQQKKQQSSTDLVKAKQKKKSKCIVC